MAKEPTMIKARRSKLAQSRIDYIVYGNPKQVSKLVYDYGYEPPKSLRDLSDAVHELINEKGKKVVLDLVKLHPDRDAILSSLKEEEKQTNQPVSTESKNSKEAEQENKVEPKQENQKVIGRKCPTCGGENSSYDSYCDCNHAYDDANENLSNVSMADLRKRFVKLTEQSEANPQNKKVADEATRVWNEIRVRNQPPSEAPALFSFSYREGLLIFLLTVIAGIIVGYSSRKVKYYANP
jgi:hypothetical protein